MHIPESFLENEKHKILWYFEIKTDQLITAWNPDLVILKKKKKKKKRERTCWLIEFAVPANHKVKIQIKKPKKDKYLDLARKLE